jgi:hypothetical protein
MPTLISKSDRPKIQGRGRTPDKGAVKLSAEIAEMVKGAENPAEVSVKLSKADIAKVGKNDAKHASRITTLRAALKRVNLTLVQRGGDFYAEVNSSKKSS